jgi:DNA-binding NtrC family response regulator
VRLFRTTISGELGTETEVEISAARHAGNGARLVGVLVRDVGPRLPAPNGEDHEPAFVLTDEIGKTPLKKLVQATVSEVERNYIERALSLTGGNRTAAAELLGLSRQSLHAKLNRYELDLHTAHHPGA